ncbi:MAG: glycoside hydrolase family 3 C-terminal domain-containing protein [Solimonas sp.]
MRGKRIATMASAAMLAWGGITFAAPLLPSDVDVSARAAALVARMTLQEKLSLLGGETMLSTPAIPRLGIPALHLTNGTLGTNPGLATAYPAGIGLAASWNPELIEHVGRQLGRDARARGAEFLLGPGVNIYRAPNNGRNWEYFGEDPWLASQAAVSYIDGVQSEGVSAVIKHFVGNNSEFARFTTDSEIGERALREIYFPAFEAAVKNADVGAVMGGYNLTNGEHMSQNARLNLEVLKAQWRFPGVLMSDWGGTHDGPAAARAGLDLEMPYAENMSEAALAPLLRNGTLPMSVIDDKVKRLLGLALRFGWMGGHDTRAQPSQYNVEGGRVALEAAGESLVLLKNDAGLLPLPRNKLRSIAVIGPGAAEVPASGGGSGEVRPFERSALVAAMADALGDATTVYYDQGIASLKLMALQTPFWTGRDGGARGITVENYAGNDFSQKPVSVAVKPYVNEGRPGFGDADDLRSLYQMNQQQYAALLPTWSAGGRRWNGWFRASDRGAYTLFVECSGKFRVKVDGQDVIDNREIPRALVNQVSLTLEKGAHHIEVEQLGGAQFGEPFFRMGIVDDETLVRQDAMRLATQADAVVVAVGNEKANEEGGADRTFALPPGQDLLIKALAARNRNVIVVLTSGGAVDVHAWLSDVRGLLQVWYPGQSGARAIAQLLVGNISPSGRLPISWERNARDNPSLAYYYPVAGSNRIVYGDGVFVGYRGYGRGGHSPALFPFGYGLSYSSFRYRSLKVDGVSAEPGHYRASFEVTNTGSIAAADVAQLYLHENNPAVERPERELKGFAKVMLQPGEMRRVCLDLWPRSFAYFDPVRNTWHVDARRFDVLVGSSSENISLRAALEVPKEIDISVQEPAFPPRNESLPGRCN